MSRCFSRDDVVMAAELTRIMRQVSVSVDLNEIRIIAAMFEKKNIDFCDRMY